ncbi:MAG: WGR domain-containing protein [Ferruginibacter sp.]
MRLQKQSFLYFKEGNSDKVYEIDLCDVGNGKFVVNFRYGRRGAQLKEGSKTPVPVSLAEAEKIFDAVETEKINKGYTTSESGVSSLPAQPAFTLDNNITLNTGWMALPPGRNKAVLQRLQHAVDGNANTEKYPWKLSRVIWKAGEYKIREAVPYIARLFNNGNTIHQYSCTWALAACGGDEAAAVLKTVFHQHAVPNIAKIAGAGLVKNLQGVEKETQLQHYLNRLPEAIKNLAEKEDKAAFEQLLQERIAQQQPNYNWLEDVYILSTEKRWMRGSLKKIVQALPFKAGYFKHIRAIYKLAELLDDFEITGILACRFEREIEMFRHNLSSGADEEVYIEAIEEWVKLQKEFKKSGSRLAYSQKTRWYFHNRVLRRLQAKGKENDTAYVKLATAILIAYKQRTDFRQHYSTYNYVWKSGNYQRVETRFLQNAHAVFLHQVLSGNNPEISLQSNHLWRMRQGDNDENKKPATPQQQPGSSTEGLGGFIKKLTGLFGRKKEEAAPASLPSQEPVNENISNQNGTPFLHLWNNVPQAYVQLLMDAEMEEIHQFAEENLTQHPDYTSIKERLDKEAVKKLILSDFDVPAKMGFRIAAEKYSNSIPDDDLAGALLNSINSSAQSKGREWTETYKSTYLQQAGFITTLIFARHADIRSWARPLLINASFSPELKSTVIGRSVAQLLSYGPQDAVNEPVIKDGTTILFELFPAALKQLSITVISELLQHENAGVLLTGLRLLKLQKEQLELDKLSSEFLFGLLQHQYELVREEGLQLLNNMPAAVLLLHQDNIINNCLSVYENVRRGLRPVIQKMAEKDPAFGVKAAETLMPLLLRKEPFEGFHADTSQLLCNELSGCLQHANKETALNLLYSNYSAAQNVGVVMLEKYTDPLQLTMPQVIALGGHDNLVVREWCWKFYKEQTPRIKYEKETSIKLLESKWEDTRRFAMQYFREQFAENDWSPETLITLADSVKPDVEAFGRELITKFFSSENGVQYLLKLSQHPGEKMQLFATNYLERFAADDIEKIRSLEFYFRSVLTRVNKSRIAKNRIYNFLLQEGRRSEAAAKTISAILSDVSAIAAIGDKAKCIEILLQLRALYDVETPLKLKGIETRMT